MLPAWYCNYEIGGLCYEREPEGKSPLGRSRHRWEEYNKVDIERHFWLSMHWRSMVGKVLLAKHVLESMEGKVLLAKHEL